MIDESLADAINAGTTGKPAFTPTFYPDLDRASLDARQVSFLASLRARDGGFGADGQLSALFGDVASAFRAYYAQALIASAESPATTLWTTRPARTAVTPGNQG
jgi:hypothetical protein